jgi:predicted nucleotidyltransferase component of viral defense system
MNEVDIPAWVAQAADRTQRSFREAVHIILDGIGHSQELQARMVMKGGLLMAIRYDSTRYTRDIDFSTNAPYVAGEAEQLLAELEQQLALATDRLPYATMCRLQSSAIVPKGENKTHQTLALKIGYADMTNDRAVQRLQAKTSANVVEIDYSYNEVVFDVEVVELEGGVTIHTYSLHNVIAEKLRSLLQQPIRKRNRRQDVYDICLLLESGEPLHEEDLAAIHQMLLVSSRSKGIEPEVGSMRNTAVVSMAKEGYESLQADIEGELLPFTQAISKVQQLYRSLPWK